MPYIGKSPVSGGFHKLDALTASATATYALTLGSAAYFPETANQLLVSLNGVIQAPQDSFTVSGSNLVFDTALTASDSIDFVVALGDVLAVQTVTDGAITANKIGTDAVTTDKIQDGAVTAAKMFSAFNNGVIELDQYRLATDFTTDASTITGFERVDDATFSKLGTGMSESSGVFTFPSTGLWVVFTAFDLSYTTGDTLGYQAEVSTDSGTSFDSVGVVFEGQSNGNGSAVTFSAVNVTDASTFRFRTFAISMNSGSAVKGDTNQNRSSILFIRIADAQ
jgi:hypothetical protein